MELIVAIATLCQIHSGSRDIMGLNDIQKRCQRELMDCVVNKYWPKFLNEKSALKQCVIERKK